MLYDACLHWHKIWLNSSQFIYVILFVLNMYAFLIALYASQIMDVIASQTSEGDHKCWFAFFILILLEYNCIGMWSDVVMHVNQW